MAHRHTAHRHTALQRAIPQRRVGAPTGANRVAPPTQKKPSFEARRASFRDAGERTGRHEFLATWRWQPNAALLALLAPPVTETSEAHAPLALDSTANDSPPAGLETPTETPVATEVVANSSHVATGPNEPEALADDASSSEPAATDDASPKASDASLDHRAEAAHEPRAHQEGHAQPERPKKSGLVIPSAPVFGAWLGAAIEKCDPAIHASLLVSLCSHRAFRQQCANGGPESKANLDRAAAVYDALFLDSPPTVAKTQGNPKEPHHDGRDTLREGLTQVIEGAMDLVRVWPQAARERLFELASDFELQTALYTNGSQMFHDSPKQLGRLNLARICDALAAGEDALAKTQIAELKSKAGAPGLLPLLSEALDGQRFGNLVVLSYGGASSRGPDPRAPKRHSGFCLESQRDVWIRSGETHESSAFEHYSQLHRRALIPSVVGLYTFGVTRSRKPYLSVLRKGISLQRRAEHSWGLTRDWAVRFATDLTLLASALCRAGVRLPDLDSRRFEVDEAQRLWLSDLWGGELIEPRAQDPEAVSVCRESVVALLTSQPGFTLPNDWREVICHSADFETLVATLRTLEKSRHWNS